MPGKEQYSVLSDTRTHAGFVLTFIYVDWWSFV